MPSTSSKLFPILWGTRRRIRDIFHCRSGQEHKPLSDALAIEPITLYCCLRTLHPTAQREREWICRVLVWGFCIYIDRYLKAMPVDSCILEHGTLYGFMQVRTDHREHRACRLIWHAALFFFCLPKIPILSFANKSITSHTWVSLDWQHHASRLFRASVKQFSHIEKCTYFGI